MKKYYQLVLIVITGLSLLCFIFYKHEYDRLRKVLEVLDFFGNGPALVTSTQNQPASSSEKGCSVEGVQIDLNYWQIYDNDLQFYAPFRSTHDKGWSINTLAVLGTDKRNYLERFSCAVIAGESSEKFEGMIEWREISKTDDAKLLAYAVTCSVPEVPGITHLVSFYDGKIPSKEVTIPLHNIPAGENVPVSISSLCVVPSHPYQQLKELNRFVSYYASLGIETIYLYHQGISTEEVSLLNRIVSQRNVNVHLLLWNLPTNTLDVQLIQTDCTWRQNGRPGSTLTLRFGHYLLPQIDSDLTVFLGKLKPSVESVYQGKIEMQILCSNTINGDASLLKKWKLAKKKAGKDDKTTVMAWNDPSHYSTQVETVQIDPRTAKMIVLEYCPPEFIEVSSDDNDHSIDKFADLIAALNASV